MFQQLIALIIIVLILIRLVFLKKRREIMLSEFYFWFIFWVISAFSIIAIKWIDELVSIIGFSSSGIDVLLYLAVVFLFYLNFRLRLKVEKMSKDITKIVRRISLEEPSLNEERKKK